MNGPLENIILHFGAFWPPESKLWTYKACKYWKTDFKIDNFLNIHFLELYFSNFWSLIFVNFWRFNGGGSDACRFLFRVIFRNAFLSLVLPLNSSSTAAENTNKSIWVFVKMVYNIYISLTALMSDTFHSSHSHSATLTSTLRTLIRQNSTCYFRSLITFSCHLPHTRIVGSLMMSVIITLQRMSTGSFLRGWYFLLLKNFKIFITNKL